MSIKLQNFKEVLLVYVAEKYWHCQWQGASVLTGKEILAHAGLEQHAWTHPPFSRLQFANFTKERFIKEKFQPLL